MQTRQAPWPPLPGPQAHYLPSRPTPGVDELLSARYAGAAHPGDRSLTTPRTADVRRTAQSTMGIPTTGPAWKVTLPPRPECSSAPRCLIAPWAPGDFPCHRRPPVTRRLLQQISVREPRRAAAARQSASLVGHALGSGASGRLRWPVVSSVHGRRDRPHDVPQATSDRSPTSPGLL